jgi:hypothetical protein
MKIPIAKTAAASGNIDKRWIAKKCEIRVARCCSRRMSCTPFFGGKPAQLTRLGTSRVEVSGAEPAAKLRARFGTAQNDQQQTGYVACHLKAIGFLDWRPSKLSTLQRHSSRLSSIKTQ